MKLKFLDEFLKNAKVTSFMKIRPVVAELLHADRLTDVKLIVAFRKFTDGPKMDTSNSCVYLRVYMTFRTNSDFFCMQR
jgi:hypothetical protein